jgi:hypothetical protein
MAPPKVGAPTVAAHKQTKRPLVVPVFMETPEASASQPEISQGLHTTKKGHAPQVRVPADGKYPLVTPEIPPWCNCRRGHARKDRCFEVCRP